MAATATKPARARRGRDRGPTGPLVLALETGGEHLGVALWRLPDEIGAPPARWRLLHDVTAHRGHRHSDSLLALVDQALARQDVAAGDVALIAVGRGPGSFTGVRIGMATALGLSLATGAPIWPVDSLAALALHAAGRDAVIVPMIDARKGEVYAAAYRVAGYATPEIVLAPMVAPCEPCMTALDAAVGKNPRQAKPPRVRRGHAWQALARHAQGWDWRNAPRLCYGSGALAYDVASAVPPDWHVASARHLGALAAFAWEAAGRDATAAPPVDPRYLRKSDAEIAHGA